MNTVLTAEAIDIMKGWTVGATALTGDWIARVTGLMPGWIAGVTASIGGWIAGVTELTIGWTIGAIRTTGSTDAVTAPTEEWVTVAMVGKIGIIPGGTEDVNPNRSIL